MAIKGAARAARKAEKRRQANRAVKSSLGTLIRLAREAIARRHLKKAESLMVKAQAALDRAAAKGVIHPNAAARSKARLWERYHQARSQSTPV